jgi:beta-glucosidase
VAKQEARRMQLRKEALERAKEADYVIFVGGLNHEEDCEGHDRTDMSLPYGQPELIDALLDIQPNMPVILIGGNPVEFGSWLDRCKALLFMFYNGMEGGRALAEVLIGRVNPSGRLPVSFYRNLSDCSAHAIGEFAEPEVVHYTEGTFVGYRYLDAKGIQPMFPFGYGLSYTTFVLYQPTKVVLHKNRSVIVLDVENTGAQTGAEVVQVFQVHPKYGYKQLCGFEKVFLQPGERATVEITVEAESDAVLMIGEDSEHIAYQV